MIDPDARVLIAQRPPGKRLAGHWEFPGGKLEAGEARAHGLARELEEELGITIRDPRPLMRVRHNYKFGEVLVDFWVVRQYNGEPHGLDGQKLRWCQLEELGAADLLLADRPVVRALRLPERLTRAASDFYCIGGADDGRLRGAFCGSLDEAVAEAKSLHAAEFLVLRCATGREELRALCETVSVPVFAVGMTLEAAWKCGATGVSEVAEI